VPNHYQILGISENASSEEIKVAFKKKAILYHPDKNAGDEQKEELFKEVNTAYQTLSNAYNKSTYDLSLKYGAFPPTSPTYRRSSYQYQRPPYGHSRHAKKFDSKENIKATFYAFLFAFVMGLIVYSGIWILEYNRAEEKVEFLAARRMIFDSAKEANLSGDIKSSLKILSNFQYFDQEEADIREYKEKLLLTTLIRGNRFLKNKNYQGALGIFDILEDYPVSSSLNFKLKKAKAYKGIGDFQNTIIIYEELHESGYRTTSFYYEIGKTYEDGAKNYKQALFFYQTAARYAASEYESTLGKAYPIMITANHIPELHYRIYMDLANAYYETNDYIQGINSLRWTKEIWPDSALNYYISAKCHQKLNEITLACADFNMAKFKDYSLDIPSLCQ